MQETWRFEWDFFHIAKDK